MALKAQLGIQNVKSLLNFFDDEMFFNLFKTMLKAYHSASVTGLSQTLEEINFEVHERLLRLESPFSEELEQLGVNDNYNELIFLFYTFKDIWVSLFYKTVNTFVGELEKESHAAITSSTNQISATPVDHSMEMEIIKSPNTNHRLYLL
ncbi:unnamed protein product [Rhizophagus irregularis]|nr:unnamed protein product [Rhizophagus irregularis]